MTKVAFLVLALALGLSGCMNADDFLFDGKKLDAYQLPGNSIPTALIEPVTFPSGDNTLYGFWVKPDPAATALPDTILYFHGNEHNIDAFWEDVTRLHQTGASVVIFDYRGYGLSQGDSSTEGDLFADADAALAFVTGRGVTPANLCLYGYSLGNVGSLHLAAAGTAFRCLIAQSAFASLDSLTQGTTFLPIPNGWLNKGAFDNVAAISAVKTPVLILHGDSDETARYEDNGRVLFEHAPDPKQLLLIPGAGHKDLPEVMGVAKYVAAITAWIASP